MECMVDEIAEHLGRADIAGIEGNGLLLGRCVDDPGARPRPARPPVPAAARGRAVDGRAGPSRTGCRWAAPSSSPCGTPPRRRTTWPPPSPGAGPTPPCCSPATAAAPACSTTPTTTPASSAAALGPVPLGRTVRRRRVRPGGRRRTSSTTSPSSLALFRERYRPVAGYPPADARPVGFGRWPPLSRHHSTPPRPPSSSSSAIDVIRGLAIDAPRAAKSGHPGTAMALAPLAHVLFTRVMRHDPSDPDWPDRDRFVLSNGHASILLYSMLYLTGLRTHPGRPAALPSAGAAPPRATPSSTTPRASRSPPARSARGSPTASAWASPSGGCGPTSRPSCATTTPT